MTKAVLQGDFCKCTSGDAPCRLKVTDGERMTYDGKAIAVKTDAKITNLSTFGLCSNLSNPIVAQATAAAQGVLTPMQCVPVLPGIWENTVSQLIVDNQPVVGESSYVTCRYGGCISISLDGKRKIESD